MLPTIAEIIFTLMINREMLCYKIDVNKYECKNDVEICLVSEHDDYCAYIDDYVELE